MICFYRKIAIFLGAMLMSIPVTAQGIDFSSAIVSTNAITYPNNFASDSGWSIGSSAVAVDSDVAMAPDESGTTADLIKVATTASTSRALTYTAINPPKIYRLFQVHIKANNWTWVCLIASNSNNTYKNCYFNISSGTLGTVTSPCVASITSEGNGWYLCSVILWSDTLGYSGDQGFKIALVRSDGGTSAFDGTGLVGYGVYAWGATCGTLSGIKYSLGAGGDFTSWPNMSSSISLQGGDVVDGQNQIYRITTPWQFTNSGTSDRRITLKNFTLMGSSNLPTGSSWVYDGDNNYHISVSSAVLGVISIDEYGNKTKFIQSSSLGSMTLGKFYESSNILNIKSESPPSSASFELSYYPTDLSELLYMNTSSYNILDSVNIYYSSGRGALLYNTDNVEIKNCDFSYNSDDGLSGAGTNTNLDIHNNVFSWSGRDYPPSSGYGDGISFHGSPTGDIYENNISYNLKAGVSNYGQVNCYHNIMAYNWAAIRPSNDSTEDDYYNLIYIDASSTEQNVLKSLPDFVGENRIFNNTVICTGTPNASNSAFYIDASRSETGTISISNNIVNGCGNGLVVSGVYEGILSNSNNSINVSNSAYSGTTAGSGSLTGDPIFMAPNTGDYHLKSNSPCINAGTVISGIHDQASPATDYAGVQVLTMPDIGAYEYSPQKLYFNASASGAVQNGTKAHPYDSFGDYAFTGYNLREGAEILLQGALDALDMSGLTDTGAIAIEAWPGKLGSLLSFAPNGSSTTLPFGGAGGTGMVGPVVGQVMQ